MNTRKRAYSKKHQQKKDSMPANKRPKLSETVAAETRSTNKTDQVSTKVYTRLRKRLEEKQAKHVPMPIAFPTQLTDVNVDCLEHIFQHLSLTDILNIADSNKYLREAARLVFVKQFGGKWLKIDPHNIGFCDDKDCDKPDYKYGWRRATKIPKSSHFKLIRCFGDAITKLNFTYPFKTHSKKNSHLHRYITEYCSESLIQIILKNCSENGLKFLTKPFTKIDAVSFVNCELGNKLSEVNKWFPMMRRLRFLEGNQISNENSILSHCPNLQELHLYLPYDDKLWHEKRFVNLLRQNSQIQTLCMKGLLDFEYFHIISEYLQYLERLEIEPYRYRSISGGYTLHFPNIKSLKLAYVYRKDLSCLSFDKPEELIIESSIFGEMVGIEMDHELADFISKYKSLTKLTYHGLYYDIYDGVLLKIASPAFVEVNLWHCNFPCEEVIAFIKECKALKKLTIGLHFRNEKDLPSYDRQTMLNQLAGEWRITEEKPEIHDIYKIITMERC